MTNKNLFIGGIIALMALFLYGRTSSQSAYGLDKVWEGIGTKGQTIITIVLFVVGIVLIFYWTKEK